MPLRAVVSTLCSLIIGVAIGTYFVIITHFASAQDQTGAAADTAAIGTTFTYQGRLTDKGNPANGVYDFVFELYDAETSGTQIGNTVTRDDIAVVDGYFSVQLDFGNVFTSDSRFLEIGVRAGTSEQGYIKLTPRRQIMPAPVTLPQSSLSASDGSPQRVVTVNANGEVGINTETPQANVHIIGDEIGSNGGGGAFRISTPANDQYLVFDGNEVDTGLGNPLMINRNTPGNIRLVEGGGNVGVGTENPLAKLDVNGNVNVSGMVSKSGGSFKIDHPLDPTNQYLYHSFVESPDMMNIYNGNVMLDANGEAWVQMPDWFEALNQEFRYQLTPIGAPGPNLYIAQTIADNRFQIAGGVAGATVSWQVTGVRHDPYAEANRIPVEEKKPTAEAGTYLHPEAYGAPAEQGLYYQSHEPPAVE